MKIKSVTWINTTILLLITFDLNTIALAQMVMRKSSARDFGITVPMTVIGNELGGKLEMNLNSEAVLGIEGIYVGKGEEFSEEEQKEKRVSLSSQGYEAAALISRFSDPTNMAGFYWTLGAGYRQLLSTWSRPPETSALGLNNNYEKDEDGRVRTTMLVTGHTIRGRLGYRFVPESWPLLIGAYFGIRHYENKYKDIEDAANPPTTEEEKLQLRRLIMTRPEGGIDIGVVF